MSSDYSAQAQNPYAFGTAGFSTATNITDMTTGPAPIGVSSVQLLSRITDLESQAHSLLTRVRGCVPEPKCSPQVRSDPSSLSESVMLSHGAIGRLADLLSEINAII